MKIIIEKLRKVFAIRNVSKRRKLLITFLQWFFDSETKIEGDPETEDFVDIFLKSNL